ncbi:hypothetical protein G6F22_013745 [Rhizopus arrhizus]|nr:hypothetical protein G6F22_013745 [Rhizopus arrhizus]
MGQRGFSGRGLPVVLLAPRAVIAGVPGQRAVRQLHDVRHGVQQGAVVADDDQAAAEGGDPLHQPTACPRIKVVAGFVQQQAVGGMQQGAGQRHPGQLAAACRAGGMLGRPGGQAGVRQHSRPFLADQPMAVGQIDIFLPRAAAFQVRERTQHRGDAGHVGQCHPGFTGQRLGHVGDLPVAHDAAGLRREFTVQQPQQQRFPHAVAADQAVARGGEVVADVIQQHAAIGQRVAQVVQAEKGRGRGRLGVRRRRRIGGMRLRRRVQ